MDEALDLSWERLNLLALGYRQRNAKNTLHLLCAMNGDASSLNDLKRSMIKILKSHA